MRDVGGLQRVSLALVRFSLPGVDRSAGGSISFLYEPLGCADVTPSNRGQEGRGQERSVHTSAPCTSGLPTSDDMQHGGRTLRVSPLWSLGHEQRCPATHPGNTLAAASAAAGDPNVGVAFRRGHHGGRRRCRDCCCSDVTCRARGSGHRGIVGTRAACCGIAQAPTPAPCPRRAASPAPATERCARKGGHATCAKGLPGSPRARQPARSVYGRIISLSSCSRTCSATHSPAAPSGRTGTRHRQSAQSARGIA